jgi:MFS family permease
MSAYLNFLKSNIRAVTFGWILTFYSSFGQTFLISLYVPFLLVDLDMSKGAFGSYYAAATIAASMFLLRLGHLIDEQPIKSLTVKVILLLAISCALLTAAWAPWVLFIALVGLRLGGQGLLTHISLSVMSRYFDTDRGKALSISSLGYSMSEMVLPAILGAIIAFSNWRVASGISIVAVLGLLVLLPWFKTERMDIAKAQAADNAAQKGKRKFYWEMVSTKKFWIIAGPSLANGFAITGFFFYQFVMAAEKGWPVQVYTLLFVGYGSVRLLISIYGGSLTDKVSAVRIFPWVLLPVTIGMAALALGQGLVSAGIFLTGTGLSLGMVGVVKTAALAEVYGVQSIGRVRSIFSVVGVFSTAIAPMFFGILLDLGVSFESLAWGCTVLLCIGMAVATQIGKYKVATP